MKSKRTICLILSIMVVFGALAGCQAEPDIGTDPPVVDDSEQNTTPGQSQPTAAQSAGPSAEDQINSLELPDSWKQELLYALELGLPMENVQQATISGAEMAELLDHFVEYANPDKLSE